MISRRCDAVVMAQQKGQPVTVEYVQRISRVQEAWKLMSNLRITPKETNLTLAEIKLKIISYLENPHKNVERTPQMIPWAPSEDITNRARLIELYQNCLKHIQTLPEPFKNDLRQTFPHYERQLVQSIDNLKNSRFVLLVAGELGAGKSSLINLLVGSDILPVGDLRCTSAIVELQYGRQIEAVAHWKNDNSGHTQPPLELKCSNPEDLDEFKEKLKSYITARDAQWDESPFEKIQLYWPLDMLQGGVVFVDGPGVGDAKGVSQQLSDSLERAFGVIYVIDSTTTIHKHRLSQLLLKAATVTNEDDDYDPSSTLFVLNRWDQVQPEDSERVKASLKDRLSVVLPRIHSSQLYPISVTESKLRVEYGQVLSEHQQLIDGLRRFLPQAMRGKLTKYYRYLSALLKRSLYSLRVSFNFKKQQVADYQQRYRAVNKHIDDLKETAEKKLEEVRNSIMGATIDASKKVLLHFDSTKVKMKLMTWSAADCPKKEKSWQNILKNANLAIAERVATEINEWENVQGVVNRMNTEMLMRLQNQFKFFDEQLEKVKEILLEEGGTTEENFQAFAEMNKALKKNAYPKKHMKVLKQSLDKSGCFSMGDIVTSQFKLDCKNADVKALFKEYSVNPRKVMAQATELYLGEMTMTALASSMDSFFERFTKRINRVGAIVPDMMKADQKLLHDLNNEIQLGQEKMDLIPGMSRTCTDILGELDMFYVTQLMVTDFTADQIIPTQEYCLGDGSFANVYKVTLKTRKGVFAIKVPKDSVTKKDVGDLLLEEATMRELDHVNIVKYCGVYRKGPDKGLRLIFVMEYYPFTLKKLYLDTQENQSPSALGRYPTKQAAAIAEMSNVLKQICNGLNYLHHKSIVHRDLKPDNVLLTQDRVVKIADLGLAKKVMLVATLKIGTPVYMAPEVLLSWNKYDTKVDIFSFAMIIWELWYGKDLAKYAADDIQGSLQENIENKWRPSLTIVHAPLPEWEELIVKCWDQEPTKRPTMGQIAQKLASFQLAY